MTNPNVLSRRQALSALAAPAALVATSVGLAPLSAAPEPDAALKAIWARWQRKYDEIEALPSGYTDDECDALVDELTEIERELCACPAKGRDGLLIKTRLAERHLEDFYTDDFSG